MTNVLVRSIMWKLARGMHFAVLAAVLSGGALCAAQAKPAANPEPDVLVLSNGDTLHGKFVNEIGGKVTFHSDPLGDISVPWGKIKELHSGERLAVFDSRVKPQGKHSKVPILSGTIEANSEALTIQPASGPALAPIPLKNAEFIMDAATLDKAINHEPGFFTGWNGAATAGATLVSASTNQYTFAGAVGLVRTVPTVPWLTPRNRTSFDFSGSYGKITQPGYTVPADPTAAPPTPAIPVAAVVTKSAIAHFDAERDQYFSPRLFVLGQAAFDHNFGQDLSLQQIYGGGIGWTALKKPRQELDLKGTVQYEKQTFMVGAGSGNQNLIGSTFAANYLLHLKLFNYLQTLSYIPAYNDLAAYSATETNTLAFPTYKNLSFSVGTLDSYLNDPPIVVLSPTQPPIKRNSFQFTMGLTYAFKSKY
jgi:hypothetical protein